MKARNPLTLAVIAANAVIINASSVYIAAAITAKTPLVQNWTGPLLQIAIIMLIVGSVVMIPALYILLKELIRKP